MATRAIYQPVTSQAPPPPTLENYFNLNIGHEYDYQPGVPTPENQYPNTVKIIRWENPHLESVTKPYIPQDSLQFDPGFQPNFLNPQDVIVIILSDLDLKNLINCTTVCKSFHSAVKANSIWQVQVCKFLPNVTLIPTMLCTFTSEQQFKIIYKSIPDECQRYQAKFNRNQEPSVASLSKLKTLELQFQEAGGEDAASRGEREHNRIVMQNLPNAVQKPEEFRAALRDWEQNSPDAKAFILSGQIKQLETALQHMNGDDYDGTIESINPNSEQGQILNAIKVLVPNAFNNQEKFEEVIRKAETTKNNSSSKNNDGPVVEDVTDIANSIGG